MRIDNIRITMSRYHPILLLTPQCARSALHGGRIDLEGVKVLFHGPERKSRHGKKLLRLFHRPRQQQYLPSLLFFILLSDLLLHHNITISRDRRGHHYLFHHSFVPGSSVRQYLGDISFVSSISRLSGMMSLVFSSIRFSMQHPRLRIVSYNAWNTMPASWFISGNPRFDWFYKRMQLMAANIRAADPDIIVLQEIRYDETLGDERRRFQLRHLTELLPDYQYIFQVVLDRVFEG